MLGLLDPDPGTPKEFSCFEVLDVLFLRAEGFSCSLDVLYEGLGRSKLQFLIKKISHFFPTVNFFQFLVIKTLDPDGYSALNAGPISETLLKTWAWDRV